jgi:hypothetical protein
MAGRDYEGKKSRSMIDCLERFAINGGWPRL